MPKHKALKKRLTKNSLTARAHRKRGEAMMAKVDAPGAKGMDIKR